MIKDLSINEMQAATGGFFCGMWNSSNNEPFKFGNPYPGSWAIWKKCTYSGATTLLVCGPGSTNIKENTLEYCDMAAVITSPEHSEGRYCYVRA